MLPSLIEKEVEQVTVQTVTVQSPEDVSKVTAILKGIKGLIEKVKESFDPIVDQAHKAHKEAIAQRDRYLKPLMEQDKKYRGAILEYHTKVEAEQRERERLANEELARVAAENKRKLEEQSKTTDNEWEKEILAEKAAEVKPITVDVQKKVIEQEGLSIRKTWKARVIDESLVPREYLVISETMINLAAKNGAVRAKGVPGIQFYEEASTSVR